MQRERETIVGESKTVFEQSAFEPHFPFGPRLLSHSSMS